LKSIRDQRRVGPWPLLQRRTASQAKAFGEAGKVLASLGGQFDALFDQLGWIETAVEETQAVAVETHGAAVACLPVPPFARHPR
jgi:hypothetical protein